MVESFISLVRVFGGIMFKGIGVGVVSFKNVKRFKKLKGYL